MKLDIIEAPAQRSLRFVSQIYRPVATPESSELQQCVSPLYTHSSGNRLPLEGWKMGEWYGFRCVPLIPRIGPSIADDEALQGARIAMIKSAIYVAERVDIVRKRKMWRISVVDFESDSNYARVAVYTFIVYG